MDPAEVHSVSFPEKIKQTGREVEEPPGLLLKAGKLEMIFSNGALRYISAGKTEIVRMIYSVVRDKNWLTISPLIKDEKIEKSDDSFRITLTCHYQSEDINFSADYIIEGCKDNSLIFILDGKALERFEKNRIGFCVLHPIEECAGKSCVIEHHNGSSENSFFPEEISPHQIFRDIKSMTWMINSINCRIDFEGDVFETEDQRNWTDASFKTYSTPLSIPYPAIVEKGARIYQKVTVKAEGGFDDIRDNMDKTFIKLFPEESFRIPSIGICQSGRSNPLTQDETKIIRALRFDHYRIDLHLYKSGWQFKAERGSREADDLGYHLELALFFDDNLTQQVNNFKDWYFRRSFSVASILLFHRFLPSTPDNMVMEIIPALRTKNPNVKIATGTNANFAQLNRNRPGETGNDAICYSIHPQEHASDNSTLIENLKAQEYSIRSAKSFAGNKEIFLSPVTIQRRFNANSSFIEESWSGTEKPPQVDPRLASLFGGCWTAGSLKYICEAGADSVTYYETTGEKGIIQGDYDSQWPLHFPSIKGMIFPVYHVFRFLLANKSLNGIISRSTQPLVADCLALSDGKQARLLLVNFTGSVQPVSLDCCSGLFRIRTLNADNYIQAGQNQRWTGIDNEKIIKSQSTFDLDPYSINFVEGWRKH